MSVIEELAAIDQEAERLACEVALDPARRAALAARGLELETRYLKLIEGWPAERVPGSAADALMDAQFVQADGDCVSLRLGHFMKANGLAQ
ncbi:MAG TPA: hypothetical protein VFB01_05160 [Burkholderiales bacterium]|nr:hypothetical protein [Burkholderiales bacterium]